MKTKISPKLISLTLSILVICFAIGFYIYAAWTEPTDAPPGGNVPAPINVSSNPQTKEGWLTIGSTTLPSIQLDVRGTGGLLGGISTTGGAILNTGDPPFGGASIGLIVDQGNVGIGTIDPGAKLEVAGQVKITGGSPGAGKILTSDANGLASWQVVSGGGVPSGVIVMWSGTLASVPSGWALCDGTNGTPDLRDKFLYGWTAGVNPGATGGSISHSHGVGTYASTNHTHTVSNHTHTVSKHTHSFSGTTGQSGRAYLRYCSSCSYMSSFYYVGSHTHSFSDTTSSGGGSTSSGGGGTTGSGGAASITGTSASANNLPPYFKLAFIMKL